MNILQIREALRLAMIALNTAPRFGTTALKPYKKHLPYRNKKRYYDSYDIAIIVTQALGQLDDELEEPRNDKS